MHRLSFFSKVFIALHVVLQWRHNEGDGVSNLRSFNCLLKRLFRRRSKKTSAIGVTDIYEGKPPVTGGFRSQKASNAEKVSIWWRHNGCGCLDDIMLMSLPYFMQYRGTPIFNSDNIFGRGPVLFLQLIVKHNNKNIDFIPTIFPETLQWRHMRLLAFAIISDSTAYSKSLFTLTKQHQSSTLLDPARGINRWCVVSRHKGPVTRIASPSTSPQFNYYSCYNLFFHRHVQLWNTPKKSHFIAFDWYIWVIQQHCCDIVGTFSLEFLRGSLFFMAFTFQNIIPGHSVYLCLTGVWHVDAFNQTLAQMIEGTQHLPVIVSLNTYVILTQPSIALRISCLVYLKLENWDFWQVIPNIIPMQKSSVLLILSIPNAI